MQHFEMLASLGHQSHQMLAPRSVLGAVIAFSTEKQDKTAFSVFQKLSAKNL